MMRKRAGALYIQQHKLLLISEGGQDFYWTPGGGLEYEESFLEALKRELLEELDATLRTATSYIKIHDKDENEMVEYFLVDITLPALSADSETKVCWYSREDYENNTLKISKRIFMKVYPKLIADGLV